MIIDVNLMILKLSVVVGIIGRNPNHFHILVPVVPKINAPKYDSQRKLFLKKPTSTGNTYFVINDILPLKSKGCSQSNTLFVFIKYEIIC